MGDWSAQHLAPLDLPPEFIRLNSADPDWLNGLPDLLDELAERWSLTLEKRFPDLAYNYVAPATRLDTDQLTTRCVLKVGRRHDEMANEIAAMHLWNGHGAARLLEADPKFGALLLERIEPGDMLVQIAETADEEATLIAASVLRVLWEPTLDPGELRGLRSLDSWCAAYDRNRDVLSHGLDDFPASVFKYADAVRSDLLASSPRPTVLHGDLHHYNVLRNQQGAWSAIDPKGLAGDRCFDVCQFFRNPRDRASFEMNRRRLDIFCAELGLDRERTKAWCLVHTILDACWEYEDAAAREGTGSLLAHRPWQAAVARADAIQRL
jgi:streptomycin 6-kinase